ncbi:MAG: AAA family ATPase, partial [Cytophagaceae bacterium]|nr:AAA family ATPase [Gemmatimonadaceae bacterium]
TVGQVEAARRIVEIDSVQVSLSPVDDDNLRNGVAEYCREHRIRLLAWRPLGGERASRLAKDPLLATLAAEHDATPAEIVLAWLASFENVVPIAGPTQVVHAASLGRAARLELSAGALRSLDERFNGRLLRVPRAERRPTGAADGEVVVLMGMPGAGKSTVVREFVERGYARLNRDTTGGTLSALVKALDAGISAGTRRWVLDNTYPTRRARNEVIECAWEHGLEVRCVWLTTSIADAQVNAITRLLDVHGQLPSPEDLKRLGRSDPRYLGPDAQFRYERTLEAPAPDEGFGTIEARPFARHKPADASARALCLELDDVVWEGSPLGPAGVVLLPGRRDVLQRCAAEGLLLFAQGWRPQVAKGEATLDALHRGSERLRELAGVDIQVSWCVHEAGPPICWCRKPLPGLVLEFTVPRRVDIGTSLMVGRASADRTLAERLGMPFEDGTAFFRVP